MKTPIAVLAATAGLALPTLALAKNGADDPPGHDAGEQTTTTTTTGLTATQRSRAVAAARARAGEGAKLVHVERHAGRKAYEVRFTRAGRRIDVALDRAFHVISVRTRDAR